MSATYGLGPPPPLPAGSGHLDILYRGFATERYCTFGRGPHGSKRGHELTSGKAYFIRTPKGIAQVGRDCALRVGKQKLHTVPDLTREAIPSHKDEGEARFHSGNIVKPPGEFNEKHFEEEQRAKDITYLMLRGEVLPAIKARERAWRHKKPLAHDREDMALVVLYQEYKKDNTIPLGEVRRIREYAEHEDEKNSDARLLRCYLAHEQIERCLKSHGVNTAETYQLHDWDKELAETRSLGADKVQALNLITKRVAPNMPLSKEDGLPKIVAQEAMFDEVGQGAPNHKLRIIVPRRKPTAHPGQAQLFAS